MRLRLDSRLGVRMLVKYRGLTLDWRLRHGGGDRHRRDGLRNPQRNAHAGAARSKTATASCRCSTRPPIPANRRARPARRLRRLARGAHVDRGSGRIPHGPAQPRVALCATRADQARRDDGVGIRHRPHAAAPRPLSAARRTNSAAASPVVVVGYRGLAGTLRRRSADRRPDHRPRRRPAHRRRGHARRFRISVRSSVLDSVSRQSAGLRALRGADASTSSAGWRQASRSNRRRPS